MPRPKFQGRTFVREQTLKATASRRQAQRLFPESHMN